MNSLPKHLSIEELAAQEGLSVDYIQAAYQFRTGPKTLQWYDGPELLFDRAKGLVYGQYCLTTSVNGRSFQDRGFHRSPEEAQKIDRAIAAVKKNEEGRVDAMYALWNTEGYKALIEAFLVEEGLELEQFDVQLFQDHGGTLNTGRGISVGLLNPTQWALANAVALIEKETRKVVKIFHSRYATTAFRSGHGFTEEGFTRLWQVGESAN